MTKRQPRLYQYMLLRGENGYDKKAAQAVSIHVIAGREWIINGCSGYHANVSLRGENG